MEKPRRLAAVVAGIVLILVGIPLFLTPFPGGAAAVALGLVLVVTSSTRAQRIVRVQRDKHPSLDKRLEKAERHAPRPAKDALEKTRPDHR